MAADPERRSVFGWLWWVLGALATLAGTFAFLEYIGFDIRQVFKPEEANVVHLNREQVCARGALERWELRGYWSSETVLGPNARHLTICDTQPITATPTAMARDLAKIYPGCVHYVSHRKMLEMRLNAEAICRITTTSGPRFFCVGSEEAARVRPNDRVANTTQIPVCSDLFLDDIGFPDD